MKIPMRGALRTRLVLEAPQDVADDIGGVARSFVPITSVWGAIEPLSAARVWQAQQVEQEISHRITLMYRADVTADMRLRLGSRVFEIRAAYDLDETRRFSSLDCWEVRP